MEKESFRIQWRFRNTQGAIPSNLIVSTFGMTITNIATPPTALVHLPREQLGKVTCPAPGKLMVKIKYLRKDVLSPAVTSAKDSGCSVCWDPDCGKYEAQLTKDCIKVRFDDLVELKRFMQNMQSNFLCASTKPYLIFMNPSSGSGKAIGLFRTKVGPMFRRLGITYEEFQTAYAGQAEEWIRTCPKSKLDTYRAIVLVSGDGLVNEVINGLASRQQCDTDLSNPSIPIGIIPAGGGNATAAAVCYHSSLSCLQKCLLHSAYILCHPEPAGVQSQDKKSDLGLRQIHQSYHPLDCIAFELLKHSKQRRYGILSVIWGGLAELDVRSERFRWLGSSRFALAGLYSFIDFHTYHATVCYLPVDEESNGSNQSVTPTGEQQKCSARPMDLQETRPSTVAQRRYLPEPGQPVPHGWVCVEDDFWTVAVLNHSHISHGAILFKDAKFNDRQMRLIMINSKCTRGSLAQFAKDMTSPHSLKATPYMDIASVLAVRVVPSDPQASCIMLDGERVPSGEFQAEILPNQFRIITCPANGHA